MFLWRSLKPQALVSALAALRTEHPDPKAKPADKNAKRAKALSLAAANPTDPNSLT